MVDDKILIGNDVYYTREKEKELEKKYNHEVIIISDSSAYNGANALMLIGFIGLSFMLGYNITFSQADRILSTIAFCSLFTLIFIGDYIKRLHSKTYYNDNHNE